MSNCCLASADDSANVEYKVKAGYLYNFTKFVTWPVDNNPTFNICILGENPFGHLIDPIEEKTAFDRPIKLHKLKTFSTNYHCHILYVPSSIQSNIDLSNALVIHEENSILSVGEHPSFIDQGGMICFVNRDGKIKLQININKLKQSELKISAKLLEVAELIGGDND
ncbi:MAG: YfiR family protein [Methylococcales bacterium]